MIVWIASYPRSGNTMFRHALERVYGLKTWAVYPEREGPALEPENREWDKMDRAGEVVFVKTHHLDHADTDLPRIYCVRDGRDAIVSHAHYLVECEGRSGTVADHITELAGSGNWSEHVLTWNHSRVAPVIVTYEESLVDRIGVVRQAVDRLGLGQLGLEAVSEPILETWDGLHSRRPTHFRSGVAGAWKSEMTNEQLAVFWRYNREAMLWLGNRSWVQANASPR